MLISGNSDCTCFDGYHNTSIIGFPAMMNFMVVISVIYLMVVILMMDAIVDAMIVARSVVGTAPALVLTSAPMIVAGRVIGAASLMIAAIIAPAAVITTASAAVPATMIAAATAIVRTAPRHENRVCWA